MNSDSPEWKRQMALEEARAALITIWFIGAGIMSLILIAQSFLGRYGDNVQAVWSWFVPTVLPTLSLMLGVLGATAVSEDPNPKVVKVFFFRLSRGLSIFYLLVLFLTVALEPLAPLPATKLYTLSNCWLAPLQGLVVAALGILFVSKEQSSIHQAQAEDAG